MPIDFIRGNISGTQDLTSAYDAANAYDVPSGETVSAANYRPIMVTKVTRIGTPKMLRYFQIRTRSSVHMTPAMHRNLALMGGAGALFAALVRDKTSNIYIACAAAVTSGHTLRSFIMPRLRAGLAAKTANIVVADGVSIVNPWISSEEPNLTVSSAIIDKFANELSTN